VAQFGVPRPSILRVRFLVSGGSLPQLQTDVYRFSRFGENRALRVYVRKLGVLSMERNPQMDQKQLVELIQDFVDEQSLRTQLPPTCPRCGQAMSFLEATVWLYGSDSGWTLSFPACVCDRDPVIGGDATSHASPEHASLMNLHFESVARREC